jgi:hypothetical protein
MSADLTGYNKPKKGGKNKRCNDGDGDSRAENPGSRFFNTLFKEVIPMMAKLIARENSQSSGVTQNPHDPGAHNILYMHGGGDENGMKELNPELMIMSKAFQKDNRIFGPEKLPGTNMTQAKDAYYMFLEKKYPTVWESFNREYWITQEKRARDDMMVAYTIWNAKHEDKHGGVDGGAAGGVDGGAAEGGKKRRKAGSKNRQSKTLQGDEPESPKEQGMEADEDPFTSALPVEKEVRFPFMGIVGLHDAAGGSADPIQAEVVASYAPGAQLPPGISMVTAVENDQVPVFVNLKQEKVNGDDVIVKTDPDAPGGAAVTASSQDKHVTASSQDKYAIRAANREAGKLLPSSGVVDLTEDD